MVRDGTLEPIRAEAMGLLQKEGLREHLEQRREGVECLSHVVLQSLCRALGPYQQTDDVGDERADEDNEGNLH